MILWIILIIPCFIAVVLLFSVIRCSIESAVHSDRTSFALRTYWVHPLFFEIRFSSEGNVWGVVIFGLLRIPKKTEIVTEERETSNLAEGKAEGIQQAGDEIITPETERDFSGKSARSTPLGFTENGQEERAFFEQEMPRRDRDIHKRDDFRREDASEKEDERTKVKDIDDKCEKPSQKGFFQKIRENRVLFVLRQERWREKILSWFGRIIRSLLGIIKFENCAVHLRAGGEDHAVTGMIHGCVAGIKHALLMKRGEGMFIEFEPLFNSGLVFEFRGSLRIRTSIARLIYPAAVALVTFPYISSFILWMRVRKMGKKKEK